MYLRFIKRTLDLTLSVILIIIFLPVATIVAVSILIVNDGSVIFKQQRFGRNKKPFTIYKFRTMSESAPANVPTNSFKGVQSHITRPGKIIRKLSLDELPQLINVLKGEMSMVGPRPVVLNEVDLINEREKYGANDCKPGITGWAQVNGRDEMRMKKKAKMDGEYASNISFLMDMRCVALTVWAVLSVKGHKEGADPVLESFALQEGELERN